MNEIRVPSKVLRTWKDEGGWFCALDDGRVYWGKCEWDDVEQKFALPGTWTPFLGPVEDR